MGTALNYICANCIDKINNQQRVENFYINETNTSAPQSLVDIKINTKNFVTQRTKSFYEVYEKKKFLGNGAFGSVYKVKKNKFRWKGNNSCFKGNIKRYLKSKCRKCRRIKK